LKHIIIDASAALALYLKDEGEEYAIALLDLLYKHKIIVPQHWWVEITSGLLMAEKRKRINRREVDEAMQSLMALDAEIIHITPAEFAEEIIPLADGCNLTPYDACYLYLAVREKSPLATLDKALRQAAGKAGATVFNKYA
jgi:predicted nucleic acid-binding protein